MRIKRIFTFLLMIIVLQNTLVLANEAEFSSADTIVNEASAKTNANEAGTAAPTDDEIYLNSIFVDVIGCSPIVPYGESLSVTIQLKNVSVPRGPEQPNGL